ncbi:histone-lysine N-methyltransferase SETMAR [Trichonephila clavipes]|nr:histone-lysine N-methyltransferase SETMAR [Trichonephila clavipes]
MQAVETKIHENHPFIGISRRFSVGGVQIVTEDLNFKKLCSPCVSRLCTPEHKEKRFASSLDLLIRYKEEDDMLSRIVTGDETWVSHITPESRQQSIEFRHPSSPVKVKAKQTLSKCKIMATVFWDWCSVFLMNCRPQGTTISSDAYCASLRKLRRALQNKRHSMLSKDVTLLHDNERVHTSRATWDLIECFGPCTIQTRPCSQRFPPFSVPQTQSWQEGLQRQRRSKSSHELLAVRPDGRIL